MTSFLFKAVGALTFIAASVLPASSHDYVVGGLQVDHPWTTPTQAGASTGAGYVIIRNKGRELDRLMTASSDIAERVEIHETARDGGIVRMRAVMGVEIWPGGMLEMRPNGYHVMFIGLKRQIQAGDKIKGTLEFEKAGKVDVEFEVQNDGSKQAAHTTNRPAEIMTGTVKQSGKKHVH
jgi:copper(I)-binding protein